MICVGIDVAKDKHDCFILSSDGEILYDVFTIRNNREGFENLLQRIQLCTQKSDKIMVGLEATRRYIYNILANIILLRKFISFLMKPTGLNLTSMMKNCFIWRWNTV